MDDILLPIAIALLVALLILLIVVVILLLTRKKTVDVGGGVSSDEIHRLLEENRIRSLKDFNESVKSQNSQIDILKQSIVNGMHEAQKTNQGDLFKFLDDTKNKLNELQPTLIRNQQKLKDKMSLISRI